MIIFTSNDKTLVLPSPQLRNTFLVNIFSTMKRAMDGTIYGYKKTPVTYQLRWDFTFISRTKTLETNLFLKNTTSQQLRVDTHDKQRWYGKIISPWTMTAVKSEDNQFSFVFEGFEYVSEESP